MDAGREPEGWRRDQEEYRPERVIVICVVVLAVWIVAGLVWWLTG